MSTHNRPEMLAEALASIRAQTFTDYEIIVVSNGESAEMRRASAAAAAGCVYLALDKGSLPLARNAGVATARGDWIAFLDDDDLWLPEKLRRQLAAAEATGADLVACDSVQFFPDGSEVHDRVRKPDGWSYSRAINHHRWWAIPSTIIVRKRALDERGGFNLLLKAHEDTDMWRRVAWRHSIHQMDEAQTRYRRGHPSIMANARRSLFYDIVHFAQMQWDTPRDLRHELPTFTGFALPRLIKLYGPKFMLDLLHYTKPRTRLMQLRRRIASITAIWLPR
ncbi:MAG: glycosyltransferase family 2 protein [Steroidobacteraceae bacterium]